MEIYRSGDEDEDLVDLLRRTRSAVEAARAEGTRVILIDASFLPSDETCLFTFDGPSGVAVKNTARMAGLLTEARGGSVRQLVDLTSEEDQP